jgi:hypothetical protein
VEENGAEENGVGENGAEESGVGENGVEEDGVEEKAADFLSCNSGHGYLGGLVLRWVRYLEVRRAWRCMPLLRKCDGGSFCHAKKRMQLWKDQPCVILIGAGCDDL